MERGALFLLGQSEHLACQLVRRIVPRSKSVEDPEATQHREQLAAILDLVAQLTRPGVDGLHIRRRIALDGHHGRAKACLQGQLSCAFESRSIASALAEPWMARSPAFSQ
jgi:hypothetical protein